jgi:hypothetical protein
MLDDIREQRDRWQQQAERVTALGITDQRKEPAPAQPPQHDGFRKLTNFLDEGKRFPEIAKPEAPLDADDES